MEPIKSSSISIPRAKVFFKSFFHTPARPLSPFILAPSKRGKKEKGSRENSSFTFIRYLLGLGANTIHATYILSFT